MKSKVMPLYAFMSLLWTPFLISTACLEEEWLEVVGAEAGEGEQHGR